MRIIEDKLKHHKNITLDEKAEVYSAALIKVMSRNTEKAGLIKYIEDKHYAMSITDRYFSILTSNMENLEVYYKAF